MTAPLLTLRKRSRSILIIFWPIITAPWLSFFSRTTPGPGQMSNVSSRLVVSPIRNSSGISAGPQAGKGEAVWYRGVLHAMAIEQTQDSARRLEHLLLTRFDGYPPCVLPHASLCAQRSLRRCRAPGRERPRWGGRPRQRWPPDCSAQTRV